MARERLRGSRMTYREEKMADELIRKHADVTDEEDAQDRSVTYHAGWTDERVAQAINEKTGLEFTAFSVARFRARNVGYLAQGRHGAGGGLRPPMLTAIALNKAQIGFVEERVAAIEEFLRANHNYRPVELAPTRSLRAIASQANEDDQAAE